MPALPRLLIAAFFFIISILTLATPAFAQDAPNPQPCKNPISDPLNLVDNYITDENGEAPIVIERQVSGNPGDTVFLPGYTFTFPVDFSQLQSLFANSNSNYLEGRFQENEHRVANIQSLNSQDFNSFHGAGQKTAPKVLVDEQRRIYVEYIYNKPTLPEANNPYTDINGQGEPKTIFDLVNEFGLPNPPSSFQTEEEKQLWLSTWGKYWEKIPTAWSEFYEGEIAFHYFSGSDQSLEEFRQTTSCPLRIEPPIRIVLPEFYRTASISDQINRIIVAKEAQSYQDHGILAQKPDSLVEKALTLCWEKIKNSASNIKKIVTITLEILTPVKVANAQEPQVNESCIQPLLGGKESQDPYCPLPLEEKVRLGSSVSCSNKDDPNKLETDNPNVICTFTITWPGQDYIIKESDPTCLNNPAQRCIKVRIWPNIRIPWLAAIWNNTLYSDEEPGVANQETGRPGIYGFFTPDSILQKTKMGPQEILDFCNQVNGNDPLCQELGEQFSQCIAAGGNFGDCLIGVLANLPGTPDENQDLKERFIGGTDCAKEFVRDFALKPKALQQKSITELCKNP